MYKKSTSAPRGEKSFAKDRKSPVKSKFSKDRPKFNDDKKFKKEDKNFKKDDRKFKKNQFELEGDKPKFNRDKPKFDKKFDSDKPKFRKEKFDFDNEKPRFKKEKSSFDFDHEKPKFNREKKFDFDNEKPRFRKEKSSFDFDDDKPKFERKKSPYESTRKRVAVRKESDGIRLNKYIANAGICSRREADTLIESGVIRINGVVCTQLGTQVMPGDKVEFGGETLSTQKKVYLLMNKPKDYITTTDDPQERKTVMHLIDGVCKERIYPVGRLDRQTTGVLLFTNDGEMAKRLTHPSHGARKIYHVTLDKNITKSDLRLISQGVELEDGIVHVDEVNLIEGTKNEVGIQLHSGKNRVVRRIFEKFDYKVTKLDRVLFAELTKKDLPRGHYRFLTDKEISFLRMK